MFLKTHSCPSVFVFSFESLPVAFVSLHHSSNELTLVVLSLPFISFFLSTILFLSIVFFLIQKFCSPSYPLTSYVARFPLRLALLFFSLPRCLATSRRFLLTSLFITLISFYFFALFVLFPPFLYHPCLSLTLSHHSQPLLLSVNASSRSLSTLLTHTSATTHRTETEVRFKNTFIHKIVYVFWLSQRKIVNKSNYNR